MSIIVNANIFMLNQQKSFIFIKDPNSVICLPNQMFQNMLHYIYIYIYIYICVCVCIHTHTHTHTREGQIWNVSPHHCPYQRINIQASNLSTDQVESINSWIFRWFPWLLILYFTCSVLISFTFFYILTKTILSRGVDFTECGSASSFWRKTHLLNHLCVCVCVRVYVCIYLVGSFIM